MPFNSDAATMLARLRQAIDIHLAKLSPEDQLLGGDLDDFAHELDTYQLVDVRQFAQDIDDATAEAITHDVINTNTLHLPFDRMALWYGEKQLGFLRKTDDRLIIGIAQFLGGTKTAIIPLIAGVKFDDLETFLINPEVENMIDPDTFKKAEINATTTYSLGCIISFLLEHKKIDLEAIDVPIQRNTKRTKRGKLPYSEYKEVAFSQTIKPHGEHQGGSHASPRFHVRAGHWRHLASGQIVWVRAALVGDPSRGSIIKNYKLDTPLHV